MTEEATNSEEIPSEDETSLPESAEQSETQETEAEATEGEAEEEKPRKATAKDRIDELTRLRREAERREEDKAREAEYWRNIALEKSQAAESNKPAEAEGDGRPDPEKYEAGEYDPRYVEDLTDWKARTAVERYAQSLTAQTQAERAQTEWQSREARAAEALPDYEEKVILGAQRKEWACSPVAADAIKMSEKGPELAYHLASNPAEAARIYRLSPALQLMELGKIEANLSQPKAKTATTAPTPAPQVRGSGGKFATPPDTNDFAAFEKQYGG